MVAHRFNCILPVCPGDFLWTIRSKRNSQGIVDVALGQVQPLHPGIFGDISLGLIDRNIQLMEKPRHQGFAHDTHKGRVPGRLPATFPELIQRDSSLVELLMTAVTEGGQVVRGIPTGFPALLVVDMELDAVSVLTAALAGIAIPPENILPNVIAAEHFAFLVILPLRNRLAVGDCFQQLQVKFSSFDNYLADG